MATHAQEPWWKEPTRGQWFAFGAAWFVGSTVMGLLYDRWVLGLVLTGMTAQMASAVMFILLGRQIPAES